MIGTHTDVIGSLQIEFADWQERPPAAEILEAIRARTSDLAGITVEAREPDVWMFTTPEEVSARWSRLERYLGRRREFWRFLLGAWRDLGLLN